MATSVTYTYMAEFLSCLEEQTAARLGHTFVAERAPGKDASYRLRLSDHLDPRQQTLINVPFNGTVAGDYFITVDLPRWLATLSADYPKGNAENDLLLAARLGELLHSVASQAVGAIARSFPGITVFSPRIIQGKLTYPKVQIVAASLENAELGKMEAFLCLNFMAQNLTKRIESLLDSHIRSATLAKRSETAVRSIMASIRQGIFQLDWEGRISPGTSRYLVEIFAKSTSQIEDALFSEVCPGEILAGRGDEFNAWLGRVRACPDARQRHLLMDKCPLREASLVRDGKPLTYLFRFSYTENSESPPILAIIDDVSDRREAERQMLERARLSAEINIARSTQDTLFPEPDVSLSGIRIVSRFERATECGGDWCSYLHLPQLRKLVIAVADVTGHGMGAAIVGAIAKGCAEGLRHFIADKLIAASPAQILAHLNAVLHGAGHGEACMSAFVGVLDLDSGEFRYASGAHVVPVVYRHADLAAFQAGKVAKLKRVYLQAMGSLIGVASESSFQEASIALQPRDRIILYTDGMFENRDRHGTSLGLKKFLDYVDECAHANLDTIADDILARCAAIAPPSHREDDQALIVIERAAPDSEIQAA